MFRGLDRASSMERQILVHKSLKLENGKGLKLVDTRACNGSERGNCTRYCCKNGAPGLFVLEGFDRKSSYDVFCTIS
eukprot:m.257981 g.257981  ORF g.257981 m.257981 type:complete len:77 (+) comp40412_c0_seq2:50-280(+)